MLYGTLYKVFLKLSNHQDNNKNKYNELTIPKIFVKILLNKERKNFKANIKFDIDNSNNFIKEYHDFNFNKINTTKAKDNKHYSLIKNHYMNNLDYSLPKIKYKKDIPPEVAAELEKELYDCALVSQELDHRMERIQEKADKYIVK
mgnify:CR=1 FL=1